MREPSKVVAVLAGSPALSSLLTAVLAATPWLRVRQFDSLVALSTYMRVTEVDLVVCDFDCVAAPATVVARHLRNEDTLRDRRFHILALAGSVTENTRQASIASGIDEVIVKPMSPRYLLERVSSRLRGGVDHVAGGTYHGPERRDRLPVRAAWLDRIAPGGNVIPLFADRRQPTL